MARWVVLVLMVAYCAAAPYVTLWPDTVRDLFASLSLARGEAVPLAGAPINFGPRAGPVFIWLQAIPLPIWPSFVAASMFVAIVASLKFAFLYMLGRRISGSTLGLCIAAAAAFPSIAAYQWIVFFHPNWVEAAVAASLLLFVLADQRSSLGLAYAAVAALGFAVQMHATALFYFPVAIVVLHRLGVRGLRMAAHVAAMSALILAWFAPVLFASPAERGALGDASAQLASDLLRFDPLAVLTAMRTAYVDMPVAVGATYGAAAHVPAIVWNLGLLFIALALVIGAAIQMHARSRSFGALVVALFAGWAISVAVRSYTSFYLVYFLLPLSAIVMGVALDAGIGSASRALRASARAAVVLLVAGMIGAAIGARAVGRSGFIDSPLLALGNLTHPAHQNVRGTIATSAARDSVARDLCARGPGPIFLHGELAYAFSMSFGLDFRLHCPESAKRFAILGNEPGIHLSAHHGMQVVAVQRAIHPQSGRPIESAWYHFDRLLDRAAMQSIRLDFEAAAGELVVVQRLKPFDSAWRKFHVERDGTAATASFETYNAWIFAAEEKPARWRVEFETDAPQWVDVHVVQRWKKEGRPKAP